MQRVEISRLTERRIGPLSQRSMARCLALAPSMHRRSLLSANVRIALARASVSPGGTVIPANSIEKDGPSACQGERSMVDQSL